MKTFPEFAAAMREREASGRYDCVNRFGYLGAYQFGYARLSDFGIATPDGIWSAGLSKAAFLANPTLQDQIFEAHVARLAVAIKRRHRKQIGTTVPHPDPERAALGETVELTLSSFVAVAHLLGLGGLAAWVRGEDAHDALGTTAVEYAVGFAGFDIPGDLSTELKTGR
jgi:hypothetical protein